MTIRELIKQLDLSVYSGEQALDKEFQGAYCSDLLSDVIGNAQEEQLWITLQTHKNVLAIASLKDICAIILVNKHQPNEDTKKASNEEEIPILGTRLSAFEICGQLYQLTQ